MIHSRFEQQSDISVTDPEVVVKAASQEADILTLMAYIDHFDQSQPAILPVKTSDRNDGEDGGYYFSGHSAGTIIALK